MLVESDSMELFFSGVWFCLDDRVLAKPMKYASLARLTLSLVLCIWSSGGSCMFCTECPASMECR